MIKARLYAKLLYHEPEMMRKIRTNTAKVVGTAGLEPAAYRFLQLHWEIIHASVSSNV
jgi:hypothetical protein